MASIDKRLNDLESITPADEVDNPWRDFCLIAIQKDDGLYMHRLSTGEEVKVSDDDLRRIAEANPPDYPGAPAIIILDR